MRNIDRPTLILAFVLAIFLWMYVRVSQETPMARRVITRIPVQMVGKVNSIKSSLHPDNLTVYITIRGRPEAVNSVFPDEIKVKVDVKEITSAGAPVSRPTTVTVPDTVELAGKPPTVTIITEQLEQKAFPVNVSFTVLPREGTQVGQYLVEPADVLVEGTAATMRRVKYVNVSIDPNEPVSPGGVKIAPRAVGDNGDRVSDANVLQESVLVRLTGRGTLGTRKVAVRVPDFRQPRRYLISVAKIRPDQVTLTGDPALLDRQSAYLETDPIDVSRITKDTTLTVRLRIPSGLTVAEGTTVRVDLEVQPAP